jgi:hypothetical protein
MSTSTTTPSKDALTREFVGKSLSTLRTPALIVDRKRFKENCERVTSATEKRGMRFRAHVKSGFISIQFFRQHESSIRPAHKAAEGIRLQVEAAGGVRALIASTMPEVWQIIHSGLVAEGKVDDVSQIFSTSSRPSC